MSPILANLLKLIGSPRDGALLRYSIGNEYLKQDDPINASLHLREALQRDPKFSAAWKLLGKTLAESGQAKEAIDTYREGIVVAEARGDLQAAKEMKVYLRRLEKQLPKPGEDAQ